MKLETIKDNLVDGGVDVAMGIGASIVSLHVARRLDPKYAPWALFGAGILGVAVGGKTLKTASVVAASIGAVQIMNGIAKDNGVPAISGWKGMVNKVVPQLNGVDGMMGLGNAESYNESLLGMGAAAIDDELLGLGSGDSDYEDLDQLNGIESKLM